MSKNRDIDIRILIENPVARVFEAWVKPDLLERWLTRKANVQASIGGAYELFWDPERPEHNSTKGCRITGLVPNAELSFNWRGPEEFEELMGRSTQVFVRFKPKEGVTLLQFLHTGWGEGASWEKARKWQAEAWESAIQNLKNMLENTDKFMHNVSMN
ncbi:MAG: hypothetical protein A3J74_04705 [Elusimicrobia bacterium RIFCSPHIGHO2_02_FULL_57_9]|nr:MAG: hypothetical protein A3J74_04705 [Elusimicrobia bacterium RIFCSPHIGHO2_02_FULL_57_9]